MQSWPLAQSLCDVHWIVPPLDVPSQKPPATQYGMRASMCVQVELSLQAYRQNPPMQLWFDEHAEVSLAEQFGFGRVSGTHAPSLQ